MKKTFPEKTEAKEKPLKQGNYAFYVGKYIPQATSGKLKVRSRA